MAEWAVVADRIQLFPHPNADTLWLGRVGHFQTRREEGVKGVAFNGLKRHTMSYISKHGLLKTWMRGTKHR